MAWISISRSMEEYILRPPQFPASAARMFLLRVPVSLRLLMLGQRLRPSGVDNCSRNEMTRTSKSQAPWRFALHGSLVTLLLAATLSGSQAQVSIDTSRPVTLTERAFRHIVARHWPTSEAPAAGKFDFWITESALQAMIERAAAHGRMRPNTQGRPGAIIEYDFHRKIGTNARGSPARRLRVVIGPDNQVITAFPF
jgi:hypothetical protein